MSAQSCVLFVVPAKAGIHFDFDGCNMDSRFRGNDGMCRGTHSLL
jgi:hypothetical protein